MQENKTFQETLQPYVERLLEGIEKGVKYASQEIPEILMQYVIFEAIFAWIMIIFSILVLFISYKLYKHYSLPKYETDYDAPPAFIFLIFGSIISLFIIIFNIVTAIKATFFPKLFLVEEFLKII